MVTMRGHGYVNFIDRGGHLAKLCIPCVLSHV